MRRTAILTLILLPLQMLFAEQQITGTITEVRDTDNNQFVFLDINNQPCRTQVISSLTKTPEMLCYLPQNSSRATDNDSPVLIKKRSGRFLNRADAGRDLGIGAGLCLGSCLFVLAFGEQKETSQGTQIAVEGPLACVPTAMGIAGCVFLAKGAIELIAGDKSPSYGESETPESGNTPSSVADNQDIGIPKIAISSLDESQGHTTKDIIKAENYTIINTIKKSVSADDAVSIENWVKRYCLSM